MFYLSKILTFNSYFLLRSKDGNSNGNGNLMLFYVVHSFYEPYNIQCTSIETAFINHKKAVSFHT